MHENLNPHLAADGMDRRFLGAPGEAGLDRSVEVLAIAARPATDLFSRRRGSGNSAVTVG